MNYERMFSVEGNGEFPFELMRTQECVPASEQDHQRIFADGRRRVALAYSESMDVWCGPSLHLWRTMGWPVVEGTLSRAVKDRMFGGRRAP